MKIKKSIFTKLIGSFLLYAVLIVITFVVCVFFQALVITEGEITKISPESMIDDLGNVTNIEVAQNLGGWIEELDADNRVVQVYGEKLTSNQQYSNDEILKMCSSFSDTEYIGIFISVNKLITFIDIIFFMDSVSIVLLFLFIKNSIIGINIILNLIFIIGSRIAGIKNKYL